MPGFTMPISGAQGAAPAATATAATLINFLVPPHSSKNYYTRLLSCDYICAGTAHALTVLRPFGRTTVASVAAAGQKVVNVTADPGALPLGPNGTTSQLAANAVAANDWLAFELPDGTFYFDKVASVATLAITMTANLPTGGLAAGAIVWFFGVAADTNPLDPLAAAHPKFTMTVSVTNHLGSVQSEDIAGLICSFNKYDPLLVQSNNLTAAGTIDHLTWCYTDRL